MNESELSNQELKELLEKEKKLLDYELKFIISIVNTLLNLFLFSLVLTLIIQIFRQL